MAKKKKKGPLRKIIRVIRFSNNIFEPAQVELECGHETTSWGIYQAICSQCGKE